MGEINAWDNSKLVLLCRWKHIQSFIVFLRQHYAFVFWYSKSHLLYDAKINKTQKKCSLISLMTARIQCEAQEIII